MTSRAIDKRPLLFALFTWMCTIVLAQNNVKQFLPQSFYFNWNDPLQPVPIPTTVQCAPINVTWERSTATGPNPVSPYFLQVYTSAYLVPFIIPAGPGLSFSWQVPFAPGTLYQICMFDKNGNTGGCQATYTVIPSTSTPTCTNVTYPQSLQIDAEVDNGPMSQYGWVDQCTDISVTPKNGTPPYTFTVAPALHPPYNITSQSMSSMNWTVSLSWASPFFVSVVDSMGAVWANGPLHSGGGGTTECLTGVQPIKEATTLKPVIAIGAGVGGLVVGLLVGIASAYAIFKCHQRKSDKNQLLDLSVSTPGSPQGTTYGHPISVTSHSNYRAVPSAPMAGGVMGSSMGSTNPSFGTQMQYAVEPFVMPGEHGQLPANTRPATQDNDTAGYSTRPTSVDASTASGSGTRKQGAVYVVHHDSGRAPVTVYHQDGTEVVELPPTYNDGSSGQLGADLPRSSTSGARSRSDSRSDGGRSDPSEGPGFLLQPRRPGMIRKPGSSNP